jgi:DNA-binding MarR family transcriptional regulator
MVLAIRTHADAQGEPSGQSAIGGVSDEKLRDFLPFRLTRLSQRIQLAFTRRLNEEFGIGISEWRLMSALADAEGLSANEVALRSGMDKVQVSRAVARALTHQLIHRRRDRQDRRRTVLRLTPRGETVLKSIEPIAANFDHALRNSLTDKDVTQLLGSLDLLDHRAQKLLDE